MSILSSAARHACSAVYPIAVTDDALRKSIAEYDRRRQLIRMKPVTEQFFREAEALKQNNLKRCKELMEQHPLALFLQKDGKEKVRILSSGGVPTLRQFRYWYESRRDIREEITKRKGETGFELTARAVTGKSDYGLMGPGARYQVDATVGDIYLVSQFDRSDIIGRPVMYFVMDTFSRIVTGMYVGLEGPSWTG